MQAECKITPFLWFQSQAEEAAEFYCSVFPGSRVISVDRQDDGTAFAVRFEVAGQQVMALNGGPHFQLNEAFSMYVDCEDQAEVDLLWEKLREGSEHPGQCGWLKDRFGLWWQVVPKRFQELFSQDESGRVREAMMKMQKLELAVLEAAFRGE